LHARQFGPDTVASLDPSQLAELCSGRDAIHAMLTNPVDKEALEESLADSAAMFGRSLALREDLTTGTVLDRDMLAAKKPGGGIPVTRLDELVGRRLARDVSAARLLREEDLA
jgi:sialic acid synthase SpsE